jgi:hypothetical protein
MLVPKLLSLHLDITKVDNKEKVDNIVRILTQTLYSHDYPICRKEARETIGLNIVEPSQKLEDLMWSLYREYEQDLQLLTPFDPNQILGGQSNATFSEETGYIESEHITNVFVQEGEILPPSNLQQIQNILQVLPPQLLARMIQQLVQLAQQLTIYPPTIKFTSQQ